VNLTTDSVSSGERETFVVIEQQPPLPPSSPSGHNKSSAADISTHISGPTFLLNESLESGIGCLQAESQSSNVL